LLCRAVAFLTSYPLTGLLGAIGTGRSDGTFQRDAVGCTLAATRGSKMEIPVKSIALSGKRQVTPLRSDK